MTTAMTMAVQPVTFYEDQVRSWKDPDGRVFLVLRDPCLALGIDPKDQREKVQNDPLFEGFLCRGALPIHMPRGGIRLDEDILGIDLDMIPMWLARLNVNMVKETVRPKLLRYQRECAKVLRDHWRKRDRIETFVIPNARPYATEYDLQFTQIVCHLYKQPIPLMPYPAPALLGTFISKYIRNRLPEEVRDELRALNPRNARGNRARKDHQHLTLETLEKIERERRKVVCGFALGADSIGEFEHLLAKHDRNAKIVYLDIQRYGMLLSPQQTFPFFLTKEAV